MKKSLLLIIILCLISFSACTTHDDVKESFFSESYLSSFGLDSLPSPKLDGAMLRDGETLYLNLTRSEYTSYVKKITDCILETDGIYNLCYEVSKNALMLIPMDYVCVPIDASYDPDCENINIFFSASEELDPETEKMIDPVRIKFVRESTKVGGKEYNTKMIITSDVMLGVKIDPCYFDHTYGDDFEEMIVPAKDAPLTIKKYTCIYCNSTTYSDHVGDHKYYPIDVSEGSEYIEKEIRDEGISGVVYEIVTNKIANLDVTVTVNGIDIPMTESEDREHWRFAFIMPCESVDIKVVVDSNK